jgi:hypothetical protein
MKYQNILILFVLLSFINNAEITDGHNLVLNNADSTIDGTKISSNPTNGVSYQNEVLSITQAGTYILSGTLNGQILVSVNEKVTLVLKGVTITARNTNAILFERAYEIDQNNINPNSFNVNLDNVGAKLIIADGSENTVTGANSQNHDGAIHTSVSLLIAGESKGDGVLNVIGSGEGIETDKHLFIDGGVIRVVGQDDAINANLENSSIVYVKSGKLLINGGLGQEGDGIDCNGYIIIDGGEIISSAKAGMDSGLDSEHTRINGGIVFAVGSALDNASAESKQPTMNLIFSGNVAPSSVVTVKDVNGNEIISYCANTADFISGSERKTFFAAIVSHPSFKNGATYHLFMDGTQLGFTGNQSGMGPGGFPWGNPWGGNPGNPWGGEQGQNNGEIKTDFTLGNSATNFSGVQKAM